MIVDIMLYMHHTVSMNTKAKPMLGDDVLREMSSSCVLMRTRLIARVVTAIHDEALRPFGVGAPQFALLVVMAKLGSATGSEIGRFHRQDRSTLTRNLKVILSEGWAEEDSSKAQGRRKPIVLTQAGRDLLLAAAPAWRTAQEEAKTAIGQDGAAAVMQMASRIMESAERE
jgi:DNA-binding MarR family transcriptional regulator